MFPPHKRAGTPGSHKGMQSIQEHLHWKMVQIATDNTTAMYYILKQGSTHSPSFLYLAIDLWKWCLSHHICLAALHIAGQDNNLTACLSCMSSQPHEWELYQTIFLCKKWGTHQFSTSSPHESADGISPVPESANTPREMHLSAIGPGVSHSSCHRFHSSTK